MYRMQFSLGSFRFLQLACSYTHWMFGGSVACSCRCTRLLLLQTPRTPLCCHAFKDGLRKRLTDCVGSTQLTVRSLLLFCPVPHKMQQPQYAAGDAAPAEPPEAEEEGCKAMSSAQDVGSWLGR